MYVFMYEMWCVHMYEATHALYMCIVSVMSGQVVSTPLSTDL